MIDHKHTFTKFFRGLLAEQCPGLNFYPEADFQVIKYPCVVFHWGSNRKTQTLSMWMQELQIDVLFDEWQRTECDLATMHILEGLNLAADIPGMPRRTAKVKFVSEDGKILKPSQPFIPLESDIQWRMPPNATVDQVDEGDKPELMHNTFTIYLYYKNR